MTHLTDTKFSKPSPYYLLPTTYSLLPDFWSRQANTPTHSFEFAPFGVPTQITTNRPELLSAARLSAGRFSQPPTPNPQPPNLQSPISLHLIVTPHPTPPLPADLPERLRYNGLDDWLSLSAGEWGHAFAHLPSRTAVAFLSPALAAETRLVSRYIVDHYLLNFILTEWAMLHASCVLDPSGQRLILMVAPHNTGKSTTALRLLRAGYIFLADGMALLRQNGKGFVAGGYPIGEVKLRDDVLALFSNYGGEAVQVREQRKTVVNLRAVHTDRLAETLFMPQQIHLCLVERSSNTQTEIAPLSPAEAEPVLAANSVFWDEPARLAHNTAALHVLLESAGLYRLKIGTEPEGIVQTIAKLT
ncbi:MAG: hypothetical protein Fur0044_50160 [Anaerolineae bacterium]